MSAENRPILIGRMVQNGLSIVELHATSVEPIFTGPGISAGAAREKQHQWRLTTPPSYYESVKKEFDDAGITIFTYYVGFNMATPGVEIDAVYEAARLLGAKGVIGSYGLAVAQRLIPYLRSTLFLPGFITMTIFPILTPSAMRRVSKKGWRCRQISRQLSTFATLLPAMAIV